MINEEIDQKLLLKNNTYEINKKAEVYLLKKIKIEKKPFLYSFIGGMWYSKDKFSFEQNISLPYPFKTYYTIKIPDVIYDDKICRSLIYVKTPVLIIQFEDKCISIEFDPIINIKDEEVYPFICLDEDDENYIVSFYLFSSFDLKKKENAWLGFGKKENISIKLDLNEKFKFSVKTSVFKSWEDVLLEKFKNIDYKDVSLKNVDQIFLKSNKTLFRSYDNLTGSFLQLPWRKTPGFTFVNSSYSLLSYEAVRLDYFTKWYEITKDIQFKIWSEKLRDLFINPNLYTKPRKLGQGIIWYNMTNLTKKGLMGYFYMNTGYSGYPGGQATISYHLLQYLNQVNDKEIKTQVEKSLEYIMTTQHENGSWPMAIKQEGFLKLRPEKLSNYITSGGTGEAARALIHGYKLFNNEKMKEAAIKALSFLEDKYPICYNGLRDIGIMEAEAFSAVSIINAFLDGYDLTKNKEYLSSALTYSFYTLSWFYLYDSKKLKTSFNFHPISYSITPRLSPYETVWVISTLKRLSKYVKDDIWNSISKNCFNNVLQFITSNNGLCEGVFQDYLKEFKYLPMEQTFATTELMNASLHYSNVKKLKKIDDKKPVYLDKYLKFKKEKDELLLTNGKDIVLI
jgi:hypothetical protein